MNEARCSRLPLNVICPPSAVPPKVAVDGPQDAANLGSAFHECEEAVVRSLPYDVSEIAGRWRVEVTDLAPLVEWGGWCWGKVRRHYPEPETEVGLEARAHGLLLSGHVDLLCRVRHARQVRILDYKSGWVDRDAEAQLRGYGWLALQNTDEADSVYAAVLRVRERTVEGYQWSRQELDRWFEDTAARILAAERSPFVPGQHCRLCPRWHECPGAQAQATAAVRCFLDLSGEPELNLAGLSSERLVEVYDRLTIVGQMVEQVRPALRHEVKARGGSVPAGFGQQLVVETQHRREIAYGPAETILRERIGEDLADCCRVSKTKVEEKVKATVGRGQKGKAVKELMDRLDEVGALSTNTVEQLAIRRKKDGDSNAITAEAGADAAAAQ